MEWQAKAVAETDDIVLRKAASEDYEMRVRLSVTGFGIDEEDAKVIERNDYGDNTEVLMIEGVEGTIGKIRVTREEGQAWIYGFAILPEHRGKGIGRKVLSRVVQEQHAAGYSVHLEVETKNDHALGLYESVGFKAVHAQDYYNFNMSM